MNETVTKGRANERRRRTRWVSGIGLLAAGAIGGGALAGTLSASASPTTAASSVQSAAFAAASGAPKVPWHGGAGPMRGDEKSASTATTATLRAAALKAVPGGAVYRIETDAGDGAYEAHMTKADGSLVTVKFDRSLKVTKVEGGMGTGDLAPEGQGPGGAPAAPSGGA